MTAIILEVRSDSFEIESGEGIVQIATDVSGAVVFSREYAVEVEENNFYHCS